MTTNKNHNSPNVPNSTDKGNKIRNVPALRFPEFTEEWENHVLQDTVTFSNGKAHENCVNEDGDYILVNSKFVSTNGQIQKRVTSQLSPLCKSQFVMVMSDLPNGKALAKCYYIEEDNKFTLNQRICSFSAKNGNISKFLMYQINRNKYYMRFDDGINQTNLKKNEVLSCPVFIPSIKEQEKIATLLHLIDERIATQNKIIERYESLIRGLNDSLYDQYGDDVLTSFSSLGLSYSGLSGKSAQDFGSGKPYITYLNVYSNNIINEKDFQYVAVKEGEKQNVVEYGDVLFTLSSETPEEVGIGSVYLGNENVYLNSFCFGIHIINTKMAFPPYLSYYVSSTPFRKFIYPYAQGSTRFNLCKADFEKASIKLPSLENQKRIYSILSHIESKTETEKSLLDLYNSQKQYLLRQMFI